MNKEEMLQAADTTNGEFFTLANADQVLTKLPDSPPDHFVGGAPHAALESVVGVRDGCLINNVGMGFA